MKETTLYIKDLPVGLTSSILDEIEFLGEVTLTIYSPTVINGIPVFMPSRTELDSDAEICNMTISYSIDDELAKGFKDYIETFIETLRDNYKTCNKMLEASSK